MRILLGHAASTAPFGFDTHAQPRENSLIAYEGDAPVCVIAPTGSGKGRDFLIPNILEYDGPLIAIDIKGELAEVCARRRRERGYRVAILDPFSKSGPSPDRLNPLDWFELPNACLETDSEMMATILGEGHDRGDEVFWPDTACSLITGLIGTIAANEPAEKRHIGTLRDMLGCDDVDYNLAVRLDTMKSQIPKAAYRELAGYLQHPSDKTRPCVLSTARTFLKALNSERVTDCLQDSTIDLKEVIDGAPLDIFISIAPEYLKSHSCLLRLWVGTLMTAIMRRQEIPEKRTLLVLDEAAQLGSFAPLLTAATLLRGFGLSLLTAWQDLAQIKTSYPKEWQTILNNSGAVMAFGMGHYAAAKEYAEVFGVDPHQLVAMKDDEAALSVRGEGTRKIRRMNYLKDELFAGNFDPNPFFRRRGLGR